MPSFVQSCAEYFTDVPFRSLPLWTCTPVVRRVPVVAAEHRPPLSNAETSVWFWDLNGRPMTIYLYKQKNEVWCNGCMLETYVSGPCSVELFLIYYGVGIIKRTS